MQIFNNFIELGGYIIINYKCDGAIALRIKGGKFSPSNGKLPIKLITLDQRHKKAPQSQFDQQN